MQYDEDSAYGGFDEETNRINALNLKWTLGFNFETIDSVHNLTNDTRKEIFYVVGHTGVIYDYVNKTQRLLQGPCNKINCTDYNRAEDIIVTADVGPDSMLVVWDAKTGTPRKTIFDPHPFGTQALAISPNGKYIATLSIEPNQDIHKQLITLWDWMSDNPSKIVSDCNFKDNKGEVIPFPPSAYQQYIRFNPDTQYELATTGKECVVFWSWEATEKGFEFYMPKKNWPSPLTQTVFIPGGSQAVTGTVDGFIIVWDISLIMEDYSQPEERRQIKRVNLMNTAKKSDGQKKDPAAINILKIEDNHLVIGSSTGSIRFYDFQFRIIAWFEDIDVGSITSISFATNTNFLEQSEFNQEDGEEDSSFKCADFIVVDKDAKITLLNSQLFEKIEKEQKKGEVLLKSIVSPIVDISVRPKQNLLAICCQNGDLFEWDFKEKSNKLQELRTFQDFPKCIDYSPIYTEFNSDNKKIEKGFLAVATGRKENRERDKQNLQNQPSGKIHILQYDVDGKKDSYQWQNAQLDITLNDANKPIVEQQVFSSNGKYLACMDSDYGVTLFCYDHKTWDPQQDKEWQYVGKHRVHHAKLRSIAFAECLDKDKKYYKLFSIAEDMNMCEFNVQEIDYSDRQSLVNANFVERLKLMSVYPIEQECFPTACCQYPINMYKEDVLLTVNEQYKIKLWKCENQEKTCKKTVLGPTYGGAIEKLLVLNQNDNQNEYQDKYLAYATKEKVVGIIKLPLEGNPNQTMGLIAHADKITGIAATNGGELFFTSGSDDFAVNIWEVNTKALAQAFLTEQGEDPFPALLEGGEDGQTHQDLKDFFYYSQIRSKDEDSTKARKLDGKVPLRAIPDMMRSMGYYPTSKEIENMQKEIEQSKYLETGEVVQELDLKMFLKLFVNHRPVYGISKQQIAESIEILSKGIQDNENPQTITAKELKEILMLEGEKLNQEEWDQCMETLMGEDNYLPELLNAENICDDVLGFEDLEDGDREDNEEDYEEEEEEDQEEN